MATTVQTQTLNDLDMLYDFAKDAETAATGYTAAAGMSHDPKVRQMFQRMATMSMDTQDRTVQLIRKLGGRV